MSYHPILSRRPVIVQDVAKPAAPLHLRYFSLVPAAIVVTALYFGRPVLLPLAVSVLFAFALAPLVGRLRKLGVGRVFSVVVATVLALGLTFAIAIFITTRTVELAGELPRYQTNLIEKIRSIRGTTMTGGAVERATDLLNTLRDQFVSEKAPAPRAQRSAARPGEQPVQVQIREPETQPLDIAAGLATSLLEFLVAGAIVVIFVIFILLYKEDIRDRFIRLAGSADIQKAALLLDDGAERLGSYLLTQIAINAAFGLVITLGLWMIGIPNPMLWGLIGAILRFVPYAGVPLAAILPVMLGLSVDPGWSMAILTIALYAIVEIIFGQAIEPWLFGRRVGLSPLAIVVAVTFWTWLWGPVGLLLSTPLTMCLVVLGRHFEHLQFFDVLLGDKAPLSSAESLYIRLLGDDADEAAAEAESFIKENGLCRYYDEVVLKALAIGETDLKRGALDPERALKIKDSTSALVQNLSDARIDAEARTDTGATPAVSAVLCVGGRGPLDEAACMLLMSLLEKANVSARLSDAREASEVTSSGQDISNVKSVCVCYLDPANSARAPYLLKRIRRRVANATVVAAFLGPDDDGSTRTIEGFRVVTSLDSAVDTIVSSLAHAEEEASEKRSAVESSVSLEPAV
jgi:predicted PurR-regulated permease PerM